jgi:hypothetical protein
MTEPDGPAWMDDDLAQRVRAQLRAALTDDAPMPADVASRLHARLAVDTAAPTDEVAAPVTTLPVGARRPVPRQWLAAAAVVVIVAVGTTLALSHHSTDPSAGRTAASEATGSLVPNTSKAAELPASHVTHSGAVLTDAADLDAHARALVSGTKASAGSGVAGAVPQAQVAAAPTTTTTSLAQTVAGGLTACLASLDDSKTPLAVDEVTYEGKDSLLAIFPADQPKRVDVFVIGPACGAAPPDGIRDYRAVEIS